ncbi:MAG: DUF3817 domain-containing protein [Acidobacteria bacterium]|nr:DUF3817 domain-containing protein [Acidobacteriota bacterium]
MMREFFFRLLRLTSFVEGVSFLALLGIAMPLKYLYGEPAMVRWVGSIHGLLTVAYVLLLVRVTIDYKWSWQKAAAAFIASLLPFGMLYAEYKIFRKSEEALS